MATDPKTPMGTHDKIIVGTQAAASATPKTSVTGHVAGGAAKGAAAGATLGSVVPVVGTAVGAGAGAVVGGAAGGVSGHRAKKAAKRAKIAALGPGRQLLVAEFIVCIVILAMSPLTDKHKTEGPGAFMRRGSAVCFLFFILALVSAGGRGATKIAAGFGLLVTMTLLVSSRDVFAVLAKQFNAKDDSGPAGPTDDNAAKDAGETVGDAAGEVGAILNRLNPPAAAGPLGNGIR